MRGTHARARTYRGYRFFLPTSAHLPTPAPPLKLLGLVERVAGPDPTIPMPPKNASDPARFDEPRRRLPTARPPVVGKLPPNPHHLMIYLVMEC